MPSSLVALIVGMALILLVVLVQQCAEKKCLPTTIPFITQLQYALVMVAGAFVGIAELLVRFSDDPWIAMGNKWAWVYIGWNALGSVMTLAIILYVPITFGAPVKTSLDNTLTVLVAGFGSIAFLRSSFFVAKYGNQEVQVGLALVLQTIMDTLLESIQRDRVPNRCKTVKDALTGWKLEIVAVDLPAYLFSLKPFPPVVQTRVSEEIQKTSTDPLLADETKIQIIGQLLLGQLGERAFAEAVQNCPGAPVRSPTPASK